MVTDTGGIDDKSFNSSAWAGLQAAQKANPNVVPQYVASTTESDYAPNLKNFAVQNCDLIVAVGGLMGTATDTVAKAYPNEQFAIVDYKSAEPNVYSMQFDTAQAAYLAGYLAAGMSKTGKVGTYGGLNIPPVTIFMDGYVQGVDHYNQVHGKNVTVLGWDTDEAERPVREQLHRPGAGQVARADAEQPGRRRHHAGRRRHRPRYGGGGAGVQRQVQRDLGRPGRLRQRAAVLQRLPQHRREEHLRRGEVDRARVLGRHAHPELGLDRHAREQRRAARAVPRLRDEGAAALQTEIDQLKADIISGKITVTSPSSPK